MRYSDDIIEEVRMKNDIVDVVSQYVKLNKRGSTYFGLCPFHNEKTPSFSVTPAKQMYYCFGCGAGGNVFNFVMEYENYTFGEALKHLADRAGVQLPKIEYSGEAKKKAERRAALLEINKLAAGYFYYQLRRESGRQAHEYLTGRGLSEETIRKFGLGYSDKYSDDLYKYLKSKNYSDELLRDSGLFNVDERRGMYDKFWNRVIFPIMDVNNRVIGFGGRVMGDGKPKYLNSPETTIFDKSRNLYGLNVARTTRKNYLILCEGYMDVISMHQAGFTNAVASLGTALTSGHASLLKRYTQEVLLLYDSDDAGVRAALRAIPILREAGVSSRVVNLKPHKDPDEFIKALGAEEFEKRLDHRAAGGGGLAGDGHANRPHDPAVFQTLGLGQVEKGVVDGLEGPLGHGLEDRYHQLEGLQRVLLVGFHFLMEVERIAVFRQPVEEIHHGGNLRQGIQTGLYQGGHQSQVNGRIGDPLFHKHYELYFKKEIQTCKGWKAEA